MFRHVGLWLGFAELSVGTAQISLLGRWFLLGRLGCSRGSANRLPEVRVSFHPLIWGITHSRIEYEQVPLTGINCSSFQLVEFLHALFAHSGFELLVLRESAVDLCR